MRAAAFPVSIMKKINWKNELAYLWINYKWFLLAGLVAAVVMVHFLIAALTQKETAVSVMLIDCHASVSQEAMDRDYLKAAELDPKRFQAEILTSLMFSGTDSGTYTMTSLSRFMADIGNESLDVAGMQEEDFLKYAESGTWADLGELPGSENLRKISGRFLVKDGKTIGIYADTLPMLRHYGCYEDPDARGVLGVIYNSQRKDEALRYLEFLASMPDS